MRCLHCVLRVVLHHAPHLLTHDVDLGQTDALVRSGSVSTKKGKILEEEEEETKKSFFHFAFLSDLREKNREDKCF